MPSLLEKFRLSSFRDVVSRLKLIIFRYLFKEVLAALTAVTLVLVLLFLSNQLIRYLGYAAAGKIPANLLMQLMGFEIPYLLALLLPLGLYLGIILAYGRMYADSEIPVMQACGFGIRKLIRYTLAVTVLVATAVFVLVLWVNPWLATQKAQGLSQEHMIDSLQPGRFQIINGGNSVIYVEKIARNRVAANNIFVAQEKPNPSDPDSGNAWTVISADKAYQAKDNTNANFVVSADGNRYDGVPGHNAFKVIQFKKYAIRIPPTVVDERRVEQEAQPTTKLWRHYNRPLAAGELQWRLSMPLSVFILALLAIPLSRVRPRQGRFSHLLPAVLLYIIYVNLLFMARNWVDLKIVPVEFGMWWVHGMMFGLACILLFLQSRFSSRRAKGSLV